MVSVWYGFLTLDAAWWEEWRYLNGVLVDRVIHPQKS